MTVTVTNRALTITSGSSSVSYIEDGTGSVGTYRASDPGGDGGSDDRDVTVIETLSQLSHAPSIVVWT